MWNALNFHIFLFFSFKNQRFHDLFHLCIEFVQQEAEGSTIDVFNPFKQSEVQCEMKSTSSRAQFTFTI